MESYIRVCEILHSVCAGDQRTQRATIIWKWIDRENFVEEGDPELSLTGLGRASLVKKEGEGEVIPC